MYDDNSYGYNLMCLVDYGAKVVVPMCSRPNCGHIGKENCAAAKSYQASLEYNGTFYGFTTGDDVETDSTTRRSTIDVIASGYGTFVTTLGATAEKVHIDVSNITFCKVSSVCKAALNVKFLEAHKSPVSLPCNHL